MKGKKTHSMWMNVRQPIRWRAKNSRFWWLLDLGLKATLLNRAPWLANRLYELFIGERVVEYPFVLLNMPRGRSKVLDVGCWGSQIPIELASLGHKVYGIDVVNYPLRHPNFTFLQGDICHTPFAPDFFDVVIAVSTIEHIGLGRYGDPAHSGGDKKAIREIGRILKPGGRLIITVPFGKKAVFCFRGAPLHRVYDLPSLEELLSQLKITRIQCSVKQEGNWLLSSSDEAQGVEGEGREVKAVALIVAKKESR